MIIRLISSICAVLLILNAHYSCASNDNEELQYTHLKLDDVVCDVGIAYKQLPGGMDVAVSAVALGKFQDFRRWRVDDVKLRIGRDRIRPYKCGKFFVRKDSFWKYPAAVLWAVIGSQYSGFDDYGTVAEGIGKIGMAVGLGILTLQAKGDIPGQICVFHLDGAAAGGIVYGADSVRIVLKNNDTNLTEDIMVVLRRPRDGPAPDYSAMTKEELSAMLDDLHGKAVHLDAELEACKSGGAQCADIQSKIDGLRSEQAMVYKMWSEK